MRANQTPQDLVHNFYDSLQDLRIAERRLAEAQINAADYADDYDQLVVCPNCQGIIMNPARAFRDPFSDMLLCNKSCWEEMEMKN